MIETPNTLTAPEARCPACLARMIDLQDRREPPQDKLDGTCLCDQCGHLFILQGGLAREMTRSEKLNLRTREDADRIRGFQNEIIGRLIG